MLDVMKKPPPVIEQITWKASRVEMPEDGITKLIYNPADEDDPVWMGWYDSATDTWLSQEGAPLNMVTWWADKPEGPTEPKPGQVSSPSPLVHATLDHAVQLVNGSDGMPSQVKRHHLAWIVGTLLKQLGLRALGGNTVCIDLGNGHHLMVQVRQSSEVPR